MVWVILLKSLHYNWAMTLVNVHRKDVGIVFLLDLLGKKERKMISIALYYLRKRGNIHQVIR